MTRRWILGATWAVAVAYALSRLDVGWFPVDAGTLGHTAERVLRGELPHRDFADVYTGGLAIFDALAFRVLGVSVMSMRWAAFAVFCLWVPAFWYVALRLSGPWVAALATLLASAWTLPVYAEGMPSWFNLWLATFGLAALVRYQERPTAMWLMLAGAAGGLSVLVKVVGLYYLAAGFLFLLLAEAGSRRAPPGGQPIRDLGYRAALAVTLFVLSFAIVWLIVRGMGARHVFIYGAAPLAGVVAYGSVVTTPTGVSSVRRFRAVLGLVVPYAAGALAPVVAFALPYVLTGSLSDLAEGVFHLPTRRLDAVRMIGPAGQWYYMIPALGLVGLLVRPPSGRTGLGRGVGLAALAVLFIGIVASAGDLAYVLSFRTLLWLPALVGIVGAVLILRRDPRREPLLTLVVGVFGLTSLVQVPFAAPVYFFYCAPLMLLVGVGAAGPTPGIRRRWLQVTLTALIAFTVLRLNTGFSLDLGFRFRPQLNSQQLVLQRAMGLRVSAEDKRDYEALVRLVDGLEPGPTIYAGPDSPEVYFLTGRINPTPTLYELLDEQGEAEPGALLPTLEREGVRLVVVRPVPLFSPPLDPELLTELERRYPAARQVGRFLVAWVP